MMEYKDKRHFVIGQVSTGKFSANWFLKMQPSLSLPYFIKRMLFGFKQPFLFSLSGVGRGGGCVTNQKTPAEKSNTSGDRRRTYGKIEHVTFIFEKVHKQVLKTQGVRTKKYWRIQ